MSPANESSVAKEVKNRLDELFADDDGTGTAEAASPAAKSPPPSPLTDLHAIVLSIDWEISDAIMQRFIQEIERLKQIFASDRVVFNLLQLQGSVARYIRLRKVKAHPDAIKLLHSVYQSLESSVPPNAVGVAERKSLLAREMHRFKVLKAQIQAPREGDPPRPVADPHRRAAQTAPGSPASEAAGTDAVLRAIAELKQTIHVELAALRRELAGFVDRDG